MTCPARVSQLSVSVGACKLGDSATLIDNLNRDRKHRCLHSHAWCFGSAWGPPHQPRQRRQVTQKAATQQPTQNAVRPCHAASSTRLPASLTYRPRRALSFSVSPLSFHLSPIHHLQPLHQICSLPALQSSIDHHVRPLRFPDTRPACTLAIMKAFLGLSILPLVAYSSPVLVDSIHNEAAPILSSTNAKEIPNSYMVVFKKHVTHDVALTHHTWVQDVHLTTQTSKRELRKRDGWLQDSFFEGLKHTYHFPGSMLGYSGHFDDAVIEQVRRHPDVSLFPFPLSFSPRFFPCSRMHISIYLNGPRSQRMANF